ncbi:hypothetical protein AAF712_003678 [Marasmius tenuissimus]|uniref:lytic cellulose monooxygenase (C4-dehydrogenating) n=1 Tax=Marasmius tenuissimus TaxID=585030 RepID=A0ABR3A6N0_9AGAR
MQPTALFIPVLLAAYASAHGFVAEAHIGDHKHTGNSVGNPPKDSIIWQLGDVGPIKGANNPDLACGHGAHQAKLVADAMPGDTMTFDWRDGDGEKRWPHDVGPLLTYMASCGDKACNEFNPSDAKWFKIMESGMLPDGKWEQAKLKNGGTIHAIIPKNLAPGNYMVRTEMIALHLADKEGGAEYYVDCLQTRVGGNQNGRPADSDTVKFPGGYSDTDPGIWVPKLYDGMKPSEYVIPGPTMPSFISSRSNEDGGSNPPEQNSSSFTQDGQQSNGSQGSSAGTVSEGQTDGGNQDQSSKGNEDSGKGNGTSSRTEDFKPADEEDCEDEDDAQEQSSDAGKGEGPSTEHGQSESTDDKADETGPSQTQETESHNQDEQKDSTPPPALAAATSDSTQSSDNKHGAGQCDPEATRARHSSARLYRRALAKVALSHPHRSRFERLRRSAHAH